MSWLQRTTKEEEILIEVVKKSRSGGHHENLQLLVVSRTVLRWPQGGRDRENKVSGVGVVVHGMSRTSLGVSRDMSRSCKWVVLST